MRVELLAYLPSKLVLEALEREGLTVDRRELLKHMAFTFAISGISRACSHQLVRHRVASYSQQSQGYVKVERLADEAVEPPSVTHDPEADMVFRGFMRAAEYAYNRLLSLGVPEEDARFVLPNAAPTNIVVTMTGSALYHFFGLRCCYRAQHEIRELADRMLVLCRRVEPELFRQAGPYCFQKGYCEEGRFSCGRIEEVRAKYERLGYEEPLVTGEMSYKP
ncbi:FAD-dependent thymidylate synthase [Candidatus Bathyarchaeota archaeon]|nr:MAG: FAD-dependent thymidylate synthase [Candidatus Bathyarchaeota archaeon]